MELPSDFKIIVALHHEADVMLRLADFAIPAIYWDFMPIRDQRPWLIGYRITHEMTILLVVVLYDLVFHRKN